MQDRPYFMENDEWYYFDGKRFVLTDKAPKPAEQSYKEFYAGEKDMGYGIQD